MSLLPSISSFSSLLLSLNRHHFIQTTAKFLRCPKATNCIPSGGQISKTDSNHQYEIAGYSTFRCAPCSTQHYIPTRGYSDSVLGGEFLGQRLTHRRLLRISGHDGTGFLQGLVTNDVEILRRTGEQDASAFYCMILNAQGRVLYDLIVYQLKSDQQTILVECNADVSDDLLKLLTRYKLRKKLSLSACGDEINVWTVFPKTLAAVPSNELPVQPISLVNQTKLLACVPDPRLSSFAYRILLPAGVDVSTIVKNSRTVMNGYDERRYELGLSEGTTDLPPGDCLPLDSNLAFLNGVSFSKGCYVGQELTARTQYTGVIRKRIMPLIFFSDINVDKSVQATVETSDGKPCGKVRSVLGRRGIGLLRVQEVLTKGPLRVMAGKELIGEAKTFVPHWWQTDSDEILKLIMTKMSEKI